MPRIDTAFPSFRKQRRADIGEALKELFGDMRADVAARWQDGAARLIAARWDKVLAELVREQNMLTATEVADRVTSVLGGDYDPAVMTNWFDVNGGIVGEGVNANAEKDIRDTDDDDPVGHVFDILGTSGAAGIAAQMVSTAVGFAAHDSAVALGAGGKTWQVNSSNPRSAHAQMNGETVGMNAEFSNGMRWPGDPSGGAENNAQCQCSLTIVG